MADRLKDSASPYLLQHAGNPVDWWPWCDEAFAEARERDVPVLLSVGYSACHWCHVMAHESFEDPETAALMNESLVAIKVDREERPDVDAVYMTATQAMTGQGGWPMTVLMTPEREPFFCGTYFPRERFQRLVRAAAQTWREDRGNVTGQARRIAAALAERAGAAVWREEVPAGAASPESLRDACAAAVAALESGYDGRRGGFGGAPKFPPSMVLEFLLRHSESQPPAGGQDGDGRDSPDASAGDAGLGPSRAGAGAATGERALRMAARTASAMARGGIYDQVGGGFARYSVDGAWVVPHFEKMLYDNALLARVYAHLWRRSGDPLAERAARETCAWMIRELRTPEGGFASALDADSDGAEGLFYTWTPGELRAALGSEDAAYAAEVFGVTERGTFEHGRSVLQRRADPADEAQLARVREALFEVRERRVRPGRDDKVVAAWNGLAIAALAECGLLLREPGFVAAARDAAALLAEVHLRDGRIARTSRSGIAGPSAGVLEDYACAAEGLVTLAGVTGEARWSSLAGELLDVALERFCDGEGGLYDTADDGEALLYRPADPADGPTPSGTFAAAGALLSYAAVTGSQRHRAAATGALGAVVALAGRFPRAAGSGLAVAEALLAGPAEIAVVGPPGDERTAALHRTALMAAPPGAVIALGDGGGAAGARPGEGPAEEPAVSDGATVPLLAGRSLVNGSPAAYVCRNFACLAPVTEPGALRAALAARSAAGS